MTFIDDKKAFFKPPVLHLYSKNDDNKISFTPQNDKTTVYIYKRWQKGFLADKKDGFKHSVLINIVNSDDKDWKIDTITLAFIT